MMEDYSIYLDQLTRISIVISEEGVLAWTFPTQGRIISGVFIDDINSDGIKEIIFGSPVMTEFTLFLLMEMSYGIMKLISG
jgi:hypothetical protein